MRDKLKTKVGVRKIFTGIFEQYGFVKDKEGNVKSTILLTDIRSKGEPTTDHIWVEKTTEFEPIGVMAKGDKIMFSARVMPYKKKNGTQIDLGFTHLTKIRTCVPQVSGVKNDPGNP